MSADQAHCHQAHGRRARRAGRRSLAEAAERYLRDTAESRATRPP